MTIGPDSSLDAAARSIPRPALGPSSQRWLAVADDRLPRVLALAGVAVTIGAFLWVLYEILVITGDPRPLAYVVAWSVAGGWLLAAVVRPRTATLLAVVLVFLGLVTYVNSLPGGIGFLVLVGPMMTDAIGLLGGLSVLRIVNADVWALAAAPGPVFLATYLAVRRWYITAVGVAGTALGLLVLTGDAATATTLFGVVGCTVAVAVGERDRLGDRLTDGDLDVVALACGLMVVASLFVGVVPGAEESYISTRGIGDQPQTMEGSLVYADDSVVVQGPIELNPTVRFTVEATEPQLWRVAGYDRYTGDGWVRTGDTTRLEGNLGAPPGESREVAQTYTAETDIATLPAAWKPSSVRDEPVIVQVSQSGDLAPASPLQPGESYHVTSRVPTAAPGDLRAAGTNYPYRIEDRYTQLPTSTPDRVGERTDRITANADNPYDTARVIEQWLQNNRGYSLDVDKPQGDIADAFLFEMEAGYCTYFATTMVAMLRSQDIPARFVTGYSTGQQIEEDTWVVRGSDSHAWVEVYFPTHGWMTFDPTPAEPRENAIGDSIEQARTGGASDVDTDDTLDADFSQDPEPTDTDPSEPTATESGEDETTGTATATPSDEAGAGGLAIQLPDPPTREQAGLGAVVLIGLLAGAVRFGIARRLARGLWLRRLPDAEGAPEDAVVGAYRRAVYLHQQTSRPPRPGETPRQFLANADADARRIGELYELARYGPGADATAAAEASDCLMGLLDDHSRLPGPLERIVRET